MTRVGSSAPRFGSIRSREKVESTAGRVERALRARASAPPRRCRRRCGARAPRRAGRACRSRGGRAFEAWSQTISAPASSAPVDGLDRRRSPSRQARRRSRSFVHGGLLAVRLGRDYGRQALTRPFVHGRTDIPFCRRSAKPASARGRRPRPLRRARRRRGRDGRSRPSSSASPTSARSPAPSGASRWRCRCSTPGCGSPSGRRERAAPALSPGRRSSPASPSPATSSSGIWRSSTPASPTPPSSPPARRSGSSLFGWLLFRQRVTANVLVGLALCLARRRGAARRRASS